MLSWGEDHLIREKHQCGEWLFTLRTLPMFFSYPSGSAVAAEYVSTEIGPEVYALGNWAKRNNAIQAGP